MRKAIPRRETRGSTSGPARLHRPRRGGILLELLLSIAIFATVAGFALSAMRSALDGVRRAELRSRAEDLANTRLAELDAGLVATGELGELTSDDPSDGADAGSPDLSIRLELLASPTGSRLATARATVRERLADGADGADGPVLSVVERLVATGRGEFPR